MMASDADWIAPIRRAIEYASRPAAADTRCVSGAEGAPHRPCGQR